MKGTDNLSFKILSFQLFWGVMIGNTNVLKR